MRLFGKTPKFDLKNEIQIDDSVSDALYRCRVTYTDLVEKIEFFPYKLKHPKKVKIVEDNSIKYSFKYEDRDVFINLMEQNLGFDDVIIAQNGLLTDATYSNLALWDGTNWITPKTYLLKGTKRTFLLAKHKIIEKEISVDDLKNYSKIAFINAMRELETNYSFKFISDSELELWT